MTPDTYKLAEVCDVVCVFVNDDINSFVNDKLYEMGIRLIELRCAGYNNVDVKYAYGKVYLDAECNSCFTSSLLTAEALSNIADTTLANVREFFESDRCSNEVCYKCGKIPDCKQMHDKKCF